MQAGRNSRLSQIIQGIPNIDDGITEYAAGVETDQLSISGIASLSNFLLENHPKLKKANEDIGTIMSSKMLLKGDAIVTAFGVAGTEASDSKRLISLLEKLDLSAHSNGQCGKIGLGTSNILSMACELLLNRSMESTFLLIEEPEAHVHAQRQLRLIQSLQTEAATSGVNQQIIITTHSPLMASVISLEHISIVKSANHEGSRKVQIKLSSIHAVKGRTHLATLVLDTYWYKRNLKSIMPWLCNIASKSPSERDAKRLKCHYVAITRAKGLICLAAPKSSISDKDKTNLIKAGWNITEL